MDSFRKDVFADRSPSADEIDNAVSLMAFISAGIETGADTALSLTGSVDPAASFPLSAALTASLLDILRLVSTGRGFMITPVNSELTSQEAADLLNVSRPYLVKLLDRNEIPHVRTGSRRKVLASHVMAYKSKRDAIRANGLAELAEIDADLI